jgi:hypothetical protein
MVEPGELGVCIDSYFQWEPLTGWSLPSTVDADLSGNGYDGTGTYGFNITNPGDQMSYLYYVDLGNKGYLDTSGNSQLGSGLTNTGPFKNLSDSSYWSGTEYSAYPGLAWDFDFNGGLQDVGYEDIDLFYGLAVRPGDVTAVPEPGTMILLGTGLAGLAAWSRWSRRRHG